MPDSLDDGTREPMRGDQYGDFTLAQSVLKGLGVLPDFESDAGLRYAHRRDGEADIYFVANPEDRPLTAECHFRAGRKRPELWDPVSGTTRDLPQFTASGERTSLAVRFEPHQAFFFVFRTRVAGVTGTGKNSPDLDSVAELSGPWEVAFDTTWGGPARITFRRLEDWSRRPEEGIRYYSGTALYSTVFDLPLPGRASPAPAGRRVFLDLGLVRNIARVSLNGHDLGVVWCAPWRVDLTRHLRQKENRLEIRVANLWPNRLIGDEQLPPDCEYGGGGNLVRWPAWLSSNAPRPSPGRFTFTTWKHYGRGSNLLPSGLLGPVRLLSLSNQRGR